MTVHFVGAGPGDPDLLTVKALRLILKARVCIYAGSLIAPDILDLLPNACERHDSAALTLEEILEICQQAHHRGLDVLRLHSGDPTIFGAIREQIEGLKRLGISSEIVPGISAFQACAATLGIELTVPEITQTVVLSRTKGRTPMPDHQDLSRLAALRATLCLYLSAHKIPDIASELQPAYGPETPVAVVEKVGWRGSTRILQSTLATLGSQAQAAGFERTALILVGEALRGDHPRSRLYAPDFQHGHRPGDA